MVRRILSFILSFLIMVSSLSSISNIIARALTPEEEDYFVIEEPYTDDTDPDPVDTEDEEPGKTAETTPAAQDAPPAVDDVQEPEQSFSPFADLMPQDDGFDTFEVPEIIYPDGEDELNYYIRYDDKCQVTLSEISRDPHDVGLIYELLTNPSQINGTAELKKDEHTGDDILVFTPNGNSKTETIDLRVINSAVETLYTDVQLTIYVFEPLPAPASDMATSMQERFDPDAAAVPVSINIAGNCEDPRGHALSYSVKSGTGPQNGSISFLGGTLLYTPSVYFYGTDSAVIQVSHKEENSPYPSVEFTVSITVTPVENAPIAVDDTATVFSNSYIIIDVLENDEIVEIESDGLEITGISGKTPKASVIEIRNNEIYYKPNPKAEGSDTFTYTVKHSGTLAGVGEFTQTATAEVTVYIETKNDQHEVQFVDPATGSKIIDEDNTLMFKFAVIDVDSNFDDFIIDITSGDADIFDDADIDVDYTQVTSDRREYTVTWQPVENAYTLPGNPVSIKIEVTDPADDIDENPVTKYLLVTVNPVNDAPEITVTNFRRVTSDSTVDLPLGDADTATIDEDEALELVFEVFDTDFTGEPKDDFAVTFTSGNTAILPIANITRVSAETIDDNTARYTYRLTPRANANSTGGINITITAKDEAANGAEQQESNPATFKLIITPVNDPPVANDDFFVEEDAPTTPVEDLPIILDVLDNDTDVDLYDDEPDSLRIIAAGLGSKDGGITTQGTTEAGGRVIIVNAEDGPPAIFDAGGKPMVIPAYNGINPYYVIYISAQNYNGNDGFWYTIADDAGAQSTAYVKLWVQEDNDLPEILPVYESYNNWVSLSAAEGDGYFLGKEDEPLLILIKVTDIETADDVLFLQAAVAVGGDTRSITQSVNVPTEYNNGSYRTVRYVPKPNQHNTIVNGEPNFVTLQLTLSDTFDKSIGQIKVFIEPVNDPPTAKDHEFTFPEFKEDHDPVFISVEELLDGSDDIDHHTNGDSLPEFDTDFVTGGGMTASISPASQITAGAKIEYGTNEQGVPGIFFYPVLHSEATVTFNYQIKDEHGETAQAKVTMRPILVNDPPVVKITSSHVEYNAIDNIWELEIYEDSDYDKDPVRYAANRIEFEYFDFETTDSRDLRVPRGSSNPLIISPAGLDFTGAQSAGDRTGILKITPLADRNTGDGEPVIVTISVTDGDRATPIRIRVTVIPVPDPPIALNDEYENVTADKEITLTPLDNDDDVDGDDIFIIGVVDKTQENLIAAGQHDAPTAVVSWTADGEIRFRAPKGFEGEYELEYTIQDSSPEAFTATATITVHVSAFGNDPWMVPVSNMLVSVGIPDYRDITIHNVPNPYNITVTSSNRSVLPDSAITLQRNSTTYTNPATGIPGGVGEQTLRLHITPPASAMVGSTFLRIDLEHTNSAGETKTNFIMVEVTVTRTNLAPVANDDHYNDTDHPLYNVDPESNPFITKEGTSLTIDVLSNDWDESPDRLKILNVFPLTKGSGTVNIINDGKQLRYGPPDAGWGGRSHFNGEVEFEYEIMDLGGKTDRAKVTLYVEPIPQPPYVRPDYLARENIDIPEEEPVRVAHADVIGNDGDYDDRSWTSNAEMATAEVIWNLTACTFGYPDGKTITLFPSETAPGYEADNDNHIIAYVETEINAATGRNINTLVFIPKEEGWYLFTYTITTQNKHLPLTTGEKNSSEIASSGTATAHIGVTYNGSIAPILKDDTIDSNEDQYTTSYRTINLSARGLIEAFEPVNLSEGTNNTSTYTNITTTPTLVNTASGVITDWEIYEDGGNIYLKYMQKPDAYGTAYLYWQVQNTSDGTKSNVARIGLRVFAENDPPEIEIVDPPTERIEQNKEYTVNVKIRDVDIDTEDLPSGLTTRVFSTYIKNVDGTETVEHADLYIPGEMMTLTHIDGEDWELTFKAINYDKDYPDREYTITIYVTDGGLEDEQSFTVQIDPSNNAPVVRNTGDSPYRDTIDEDTQGEYDVGILGSDPDGTVPEIVFAPDDAESGTGIFYFAYDADADTYIEYDNTNNDYGYVNLTAGNRRLNYYPPAYFNTGAEHKDLVLNPTTPAELAGWDTAGGDYIEIRYRLKDDEPAVSADIGIIRVKIRPVNNPPEIFGLQTATSYMMLEDKPEPIVFYVRDVDTADFEKNAKITINMRDSYDPDDLIDPGFVINSQNSNYIKPIPKEYITIEKSGTSGKEYKVTLNMEFFDDKHHDDLIVYSRTIFSIAISDEDGDEPGVATARFSVKITGENDPVFPIEDITLPFAPNNPNLTPYLKEIRQESGRIVYFMEIDEDINPNSNGASQGVSFDLVKLFDDIDGGRDANGNPIEIFISEIYVIRGGSAVNRNNMAHFTPTRDLFHEDETLKNYALYDDAADIPEKLARFDFTVIDLYGAEYASTVYIFINAVNDPPVTPNFTAQTDEDTPVYITPIPVTQNNTRVRDVDNPLDDLTITDARVRAGDSALGSKVYIVPAGMEVALKDEEDPNSFWLDGSGNIVCVPSDPDDVYPRDRLYYVPGEDENSPDHGPAATGGAFRIDYTVSDNNTTVKPGTPGESTGTVSVTVRSVHDFPRLNLDVDTTWIMYEDNEFRYNYYGDAHNYWDEAIETNPAHQSPFPLRMWSPEVEVDLSLIITSFNWNETFWNDWSTEKITGDDDVSTYNLAANTSVVRTRNIETLRNPLDALADLGWLDIFLTPELNQSGQLILRLDLDDGSHKTTKYVRVIVRPVNDVPVAYPQIIATGSNPDVLDNGVYKYTIYEGSELERTVTGTDVETPNQLTFREPTQGDATRWNKPVSSLTELLPKNGTLEVYNVGALRYWKYTPNEYFYGDDYFYLAVQDAGIRVDGVDLPAEVGFVRIEVLVKDVNSPPSTPRITRTLNERTGGSGEFKDGDEVTVFFTPSSDAPGETPADELKYTFEVTYNGSTWIPIASGLTTTGPEITVVGENELSYTFTPAPGQNTDDFQIRIIVWDTVIVDAPAERSADTPSYYSSKLKLDNTEPEIVSHTLTPGVFTNQDVEITLTIEDPAAGATGIDKVYLVDEHGSITETIYDSEGAYPKTVSAKHTVTLNGTYWFKVTDAIGHTSEPYDVIVGIIDRLDPAVDADIKTIPLDDGTTVEPAASVELTYTDDDSGDNGDEISGVDLNNSKHILTKSMVKPIPTDPGWVTCDDYTQIITLDTKGVWYIYAVVTDYAGNTVTEKFGPYEINNSKPKANPADYDVPEAVYTWSDAQERYIQSPGTVTIDFEQHVDDDDGWDDIDYITPDAGTLPESKYGELTQLSKGEYLFTHSGEGKDPFEKVLTFDYTATDKIGGDVDGEIIGGETSSPPATVTINVIEVNDPPSAPGTITANNTNYSHGNATANEVILSWVASTDEEEASSELKYQVQVRYREGTGGTGSWGAWADAGETAKGVVTFKYDVPDGLTGEMQFRVRAVDNGLSADGEDDLGVMRSGYTVSGTHNLDNAPPEVDHSPKSFDYTNENITFTLTVTEQRIGDTGIDSVEYTGNKTITFTPDAGNTTAKHVYTVTVPVNDTYEFEVTDAVGNSQVYSVTIDKIDRLNPYAEANIEKIDYDDADLGKVYAKQKSVTLTYSDETATTDYAMSGVAERYYVIDNNAAAPASGSSAWKTYTAPIPLDTKGVWYIHYKVIDEAGNEIRGTFGHYQINNSLPIARNSEPGEFEVWEHDLDGDRNSVTINFRDFVTDVDGADDITGFVVTPDPEMAAHGSWTGNSTTGIYTFTHNGKGNPFVDEFVVEYYALDKSGDGDSRENNSANPGNPNTITIGVTEINDPPKAPVNITPKAPAAYKDGDTAELSWDIPVDAGGNADIDEETDPGNIIYELEVSYDGGTSWITAGSTSSGETSFDFDVLSTNTGGENGILQFRIRTNDRGFSATGTQILTAERSDWAYSDEYLLDNTAPLVDNAGDELSTTGDTNEDVTITLVVTDNDTGDTGIKRVTYLGDYTHAENFAKTEGSDKTVNGRITEQTWTLTVKQNGSYTFELEDEIGNTRTHTVTVGNIDKAAPDTITADPPHLIGETNAVYSLQNETVELWADDADGTALNKKSGVEKVEFIKELTTTERDVTDPNNAPAKPAANDSRWEEYDGIGVPLNKKGRWIIHVKATDAAGNVTVKSFGTYLVLNHNPTTTDGTEEVYEHELVANDGKNTVVIDLFDYATDPDDAFNPGGKSDIVEFIVTPNSDMRDHGTLTELWDTALPDPTDDPNFGKYLFTHNGKGNPFVDTLEMTFVAIDSDGNTSTESESDDSAKPASVITISVIEVNDAPTAPTNITPAARAYKDEMTVNLRWTASSDEETETAKLFYEIDLFYSEEGSWNNIHTTAPGVTSYDYTIPADEYLGTMQFRIRAADDGLAADGVTDLGVKRSAYALSPVYRLSYGPLAVKDGEVTVWEHAVASDSNSSNTVDIDLRDFITNMTTYTNNNQDLTFTITQAPDTTFGSWTRLSNGVYRFVHNGLGNPFADKLFVKFYATDSDGFVSETETVTIKVIEINDVPTTPAQLTASAAAFKDGADVTLSWRESSDEETLQSALKYNVQVSYDGGAWSDIGTTTGAAVIDYTIDNSGNDGTVSFRVQAEDTHATLSAEKSGWIQIGPLVVDNTPPDAGVVFTVGGEPYIPGGPAVEEVDITVTFTDDGGSGLAIFGYALTEDTDPPQDANGNDDLSAYTMLTQAAGSVITCPSIGQFFLHLYAIDKAGNEYFVTVNPPDEPIDVLNTRPIAKSQTVSVDMGESVEITLEGFDNDPGDSIKAYLIETSVKHGTLERVNGYNNVYLYTHDNSEAYKNDSFTFAVTDTSYGIKSSPGVVTIIVIPPPYVPPVPEENGTGNGNGNASDDEDEQPPVNGTGTAAEDEDEEDVDAVSHEDEEISHFFTNAVPPAGGGLVTGLSVMQYGEGSLILVVQSAENEDIHQKPLVALTKPHDAIVSILSKQDLERVLNGARIEIRVKVNYIRQGAHQQDKILIEEAIETHAADMPGLTLGEYLDITVDYRYENQEYINVTQTNGEIELCIDISKDMRNMRALDYFIFRSHDGEATLLFDLDDHADTITFRTDCFSIYAKAYTRAGVGSRPCLLCGHCSEPLGICTYIWIIAFLTNTAIMLYTTVRNRKYDYFDTLIPKPAFPMF